VARIDIHTPQLCPIEHFPRLGTHGSTMGIPDHSTSDFRDERPHRRAERLPGREVGEVRVDPLTGEDTVGHDAEVPVLPAIQGDLGKPSRIGDRCITDHHATVSGIHIGTYG
jgi:hypothetical protein